MSQITLPDNVKPILSPRSRPTMQYAFVTSDGKEFFQAETRRLAEMGYSRGRNHYQGNKEGGCTECYPETSAEEKNLKRVRSSIGHLNIKFTFWVRKIYYTLRRRMLEIGAKNAAISDSISKIKL